MEQSVQMMSATRGRVLQCCDRPVAFACKGVLNLPTQRGGVMLKTLSLNFSLSSSPPPLANSLSVRHQRKSSIICKARDALDEGQVLAHGEYVSALLFRADVIIYTGV